MTRSKFALFILIILAGLGRFWLIETESVAFNSDEAVVGLMARHITQGEPIPTFYYGQAYMGSLDAVLIAGGFKLLGESIRTIRLVQAILYLLSLVTAYYLALTITHQPRIGLITVLLLAIPTMLGTLYTTITLGGYNELVLFGNLILLFSWRVTVHSSTSILDWGLLGLFMGLGWWTNGAIATPIGVVGLLGIYHFSWQHWKFYLLALIFFFIGSAPWWLYNLHHDWAALDFLLNQEIPQEAEPFNFVEKIIAFLIVGISSLYGFRFPWEASLQTGLLVLAAAATYIGLFSHMLTRYLARLRANDHWANILDAERWVWLNFLVLTLIFILSAFQDSTGRYLMPLWVPATIGIAIGIAHLKWQYGALALSAVLAFQFNTTIMAAYSDVGIEQQLIEGLQIPAEDDQQLLEFMQDHHFQYGYTSYWVSYRLMFRSQETVIFDTSLPYDDMGYRANNNRYQPYVDRVVEAEQVVWITQNFPDLDRIIAAKLQLAGIEYSEADIGVYHIYYDFSQRVAPADFNLNTTEPLTNLE